MSSIKYPKDMEILKFLQQPRNRYEIAKRFKNHYASALAYIERLEDLGLIFVLREEPWRPGKVMKYYLITSKGRSLLRGYEEAERRE